MPKTEMTCQCHIPAPCPVHPAPPFVKTRIQEMKEQLMKCDPHQPVALGTLNHLIDILIEDGR